MADTSSVIALRERLEFSRGRATHHEAVLRRWPVLEEAWAQACEQRRQSAQASSGPLAPRAASGAPDPMSR